MTDNLLVLLQTVVFFSNISVVFSNVSSFLPSLFLQLYLLRCLARLLKHALGDGQAWFFVRSCVFLLTGVFLCFVVCRKLSGGSADGQVDFVVQVLIQL